jgi:hypothetical protein
VAIVKRYGLKFTNPKDDLDIEMECIRRGGRFPVQNTMGGMGLPFHYERMRRILWPKLDGDHNGQRWHTLCKNEILKNKVTVLMGPGSSGKTHEASWIYLCEYFCFPEETCVLVSSTDIRGLRLRVWGEMTMLWEKAIERCPRLPGYILDSRIAITTDRLEDGDFSDRSARDMRKGIIGIPTIQGGKFIGLAKWQGIKQKRVRLIADEASVMGPSFLSAFANLNKNEDFKAIVIGNPQDPMDPLGKAAEPIDGWSGHLEPKKTDVWKTRFMNGTCVNLIGTDSPNFDFPPNEPTRFKYLISKEKIADTLSFFAKDSIEYYSQCIGSMKIGTMDYRVITRDLCRTFGALEGVIWEGEDTVKVCGLDASYGGDRCVCGYIEFGKDIDGHVVISVGPPQIVPIIVDPENIPETQIAIWVKDYCTSHDIPPENFFHDSTGRGTLGTALGRIWSNDCNPVEFGGAATNRIVSMDLYVFDPETQQRRLKRCNEHYDRFVSELWYQVRYVIESRQMRNFPEEVMDEMCMRIWEKLKNNRTSVETKEVMKKRVGRSPDLGDWLAICVEGARRLGFQIQKLPNKSAEPEQEQWLENELAKHRSFMQKHELSSR